jgi:6-phosphofructokinase 1
LNNVIRELVNTLKQLYGIKGKVYGIQGGYRGFHDFEQFPPIELTPELVQNIHHEGGTVLGSSRGGFDIEKIVAFMKDRSVNHLYVIGGDGTHRGAFKIHEACMERVSRGIGCPVVRFSVLIACSTDLLWPLSLQLGS